MNNIEMILRPFQKIASVHTFVDNDVDKPA